jgi:hypothetical protein
MPIDRRSALYRFRIKQTMRRPATYQCSYYLAVGDVQARPIGVGRQCDGRRPMAPGGPWVYPSTVHVFRLSIDLQTTGNRCARSDNLAFTRESRPFLFASRESRPFLLRTAVTVFCFGRKSRVCDSSGFRRPAFPMRPWSESCLREPWSTDRIRIWPAASGRRPAAN